MTQQRKPNSSEIEEQLILRVPTELATEIRQMIQTDKVRGLSFKMDDSGRKGLFYYGNKEFPLTLVDLPCIVETQKTLNGKHFYKSGDIGQMLVVQDPSVPADLDIDNDFQSNSGLTPPTRSIRKRKFRSRKQIPQKEIEETETELVAKLKKDNQEENDDGRETKRERSSMVNIKSNMSPPASKPPKIKKQKEVLTDSPAQIPTKPKASPRKRNSVPKRETKEQVTIVADPLSPAPRTPNSKPPTPKPTTPQAPQEDSRLKELSEKKNQLLSEFDLLKKKRQEAQDQIAGESNPTMKSRLMKKLNEVNQLLEEKEKELNSVIQELSAQ